MHVKRYEYCTIFLVAVIEQRNICITHWTWLPVHRSNRLKGKEEQLFNELMY